MKHEDIGYLFEIAPDYPAGISKAKSRKELLAHLLKWDFLAWDAIKTVKAKSFNWDEWLAGDLKERKGVFAGEAYARKYGEIRMPDAILKVGIIASTFHAPFGVAYKRLYESGMVQIVNGEAHVTLQDAPHP